MSLRKEKGCEIMVETKLSIEFKEQEGVIVKPKIGLEKRRLLRIRKLQKSKKPDFIRQESWRYKRVKSSWRRPRGRDSRMRKKDAGWPKSVSIGYRSPRKVSGLHPSGFEEILIYNPKDLEKVNSKNVVRIGHTVGLKKRLMIIEKASELNLRVLNTRGVGEDELKESEKNGL
jgi:large subunit ribosomal protein L32e